ncbi:methylenetetrahydrofolate reductase (NADPH) [Rhodovulum imhoffii]|uniref:Methylenetetrahydrofolate reductase (NADPH) n=1 Tax=Rhodovulum imhoffii TaxID=365340 RepID=A0A2T5BTH0_9RHOB|nr:5,10-methylenetetrahydrofolate reductase [Rhodovulum imhoffii]MBK5934328.1 5,10-methylenetetrahydrofolate reductase [Rhodovulum imhoffii]PTN02721.1 methylenetetrahydrofolate reductase (NADPH) [Rhodovulum imhoffii]
MGILPFTKHNRVPRQATQTEAFLQGHSIEVMPRTAAKIEDFRQILPAGTRVYIAHLAGTPIGDMVATATRLRTEGFEPMPHIPARLISDTAMLEDWIARYQGEAGVRQALVLAGGVARPEGAFHCSMQLLETGVFDRAGFTRLHVAGHPEGSRDIDADGSDRRVMEALHWKQAFSERTDAKMAIVTQFAFDADPVIAWAGRLAAEGIGLPVHIGVAGPARLQTLLKFAIACGVGPSLKVLQRRAHDVSKLVMPFEPTGFIARLAAYKAAHPDFGIERVHFFPLGGIVACTGWVQAHTGAARPATQP